MAGNPTFDVLEVYADWLRDQMPLLPQSPDGHTGHVPVEYAHPGDRHVGNALVYFGDIDDEFTVHSMRADVLRRHVEVEFDIVIVTVLRGPNEHAALQRECDDFVHSIRRIIDLDIATEQHLHAPSLVQVARVLRSTTERGATADGVGTRLTLRVAFTARYLD